MGREGIRERVYANKKNVTLIRRMTVLGVMILIILGVRMILTPKWISILQHQEYITKSYRSGPPETYGNAGSLLGSPLGNHTCGRVKEAGLGLHSVTTKASLDPKDTLKLG